MARPAVRGRARSRRRSEGAAMFIVAVTLGLLAAMGVYGLSATAYDIRAAGHHREATQAQHAAEQGIIMAAETIQPGTAGEIVRAMQAESTIAIRSGSVCKTGKPISTAADVHAQYRAAESCFILTPNEMQKISLIKTGWGTAVYRDTTPAEPGALGDVKLFPFIRVELTNPIEWQSPAGYTASTSSIAPPIFTQVRATVFVELKQGETRDKALKENTAQVVATGRGRLIVGPYSP